MPRTDIQRSDAQERPPEGFCRSIRVERQLSGGLWDAFLANRTEGTLYHHRAWDKVFDVYRLPVFRLAALDSDRVVGVLPLVWQGSWLFGSQLVSLPWFDSAGVLADDATVYDALLSEALNMAAERHAAKLHVRQPSPIEHLPPARSDKVLMRLPLDEDPGRMWDRFSAKVRNQIRKAQKEGLTYESGGSELLEAFYSVYSTNMRDLGSPAHSFRFFQEVATAFPAVSRLHVIRHEGRAIGAALALGNGTALEIPWASSLRRYNPYCVNHLLYWQLIQIACREGFRHFHFGRSTIDSGTYHFKKQWGAESLPLHWYTLRQDGAAASSAERPEESFSLARRVWQRLPKWIAELLGSRIIRKVA